MTRFVTIKRFSELTGYSARAVEGKLHRGDWLEGREFRKAPDGRILLDMEAYEQWVLGQAALGAQRTAASSSTSTSAGRAAASA